MIPYLNNKVEALNTLNTFIATNAPRLFAELEKFNGMQLVLTDGETRTAKAKKALAPFLPMEDAARIYFQNSNGNVWVTFSITCYLQQGSITLRQSVYFGQQKNGIFQTAPDAFKSYMDSAAKQYTPAEIAELRQQYDQKQKELSDLYYSIPDELRDGLRRPG